MNLKINLYPNTFDVTANYSGLNRILRSVLAAVLFFLVIYIFQSINFLLVFIALIAFIFLADKYARPLYPDWPKKKHFIGNIELKEASLIINSQDCQTFELENIQELLIFHTLFKGHAYGQMDSTRNGNGLLFIKLKTNETSHFKFNIDNANELRVLNDLIEIYKEKIPYFQLYGMPELNVILNSEFTGRIVYR